MGITFVYPEYLVLLLLIPLTVGLALLGRRALSSARLWGGLLLRSLLLALIVFALAGIQLRQRADHLTAVFLLDVSDSISPAEQERGEALIRQAVTEMPAGDRAAVVLFGEDALVERLPDESPRLSDLASVPVSTRTDIAEALQLGLALFPDEGARRMVLLSDGRENLGAALEQAELAAAYGVELVYAPLGEEAGAPEVLVESLNAPPDARQGEELSLEVVVRSNEPTGAALRVFADGALIYTRDVSLQAGANRFTVPVQADETGFRRFRAQVIPDTDNRLQNNEAAAFTVVHGPPRVFIAEGQPGEADNLAQALTEAGMEVVQAPPQALPASLPELAGYDAVVLANVNAGALPTGAMEALPVYVRDLGRGLLMTGGQDAFGAGGYLRTPLEDALPVRMEVQNRDLTPNLALVLAVDKSGSMGRCHCDDPDLNQSYERREVGQPKVDIAKEAIMRSASALGSQDYLGVVAFDSQPRWAQEVSLLIDPLTLEQRIGAFQADGQTNLKAGVEAAYRSLENVDARRKHIILMTDGWVHTGELTGLALEMKEKGITLSVIAAGEGSAEYLEALAVNGGGRYYPATDILNVPDIFLQETVKSVGEYIIEEPFYPLPAVPSPVLRGLDAAALPALLGYNGATPKNTARLDLLTPRGDPLLATWQYGLGRAAAWTSDLKGQWGREFVAWEGFGRFAAQLVGWTLPAPQTEGLFAQAALEQGQAVVRLEAVDEEGRPRNFLDVSATLIEPDLERRDIELQQAGAGHYEARIQANEPGAYLLRIGANEGDQSLGQTTLGLVVPYSPEYAAAGVDRGLLGEAARLTGGGPLLAPAEVFLHNLPAAAAAREIWRPLLLVVALLFPLDVALRRVMFGSRDYALAREWIRARLPWSRRETAAGGPRVLGNLFEARERARERRRRVPVGEDDAHPAGEQAAHTSRPVFGVQNPQSENQNQQPSPPPASQEDALERLRAAKRRARRE